MERGIFLYPWDLLDNGTEETIGQLKEMKITYVSLSVLYHTAKLLLPHDSKHHMYINEGGTCFYNFQPDRYGRLRPIKNPCFDARPGDFLRDAVVRFHEEGIRVCAWIVMFHNDYLAEKYPECALQNCYGESARTNLCPSNQEVYSYGLNLTEEAAALGVDELHLESVDYAGFIHGDHHEMQAYEDTAGLDRLLGTCYCPHCRKKAYKEGIDADRLKELAKKETDDFLNFRRPLSEASEFGRLFSSYLRMRQGQIASFYKDVRMLLKKKRLAARVKPILWLAGGSDPRLYGVDMHKLGAYVDGVIAAYPDTVINVPDFVKRLRAYLPDFVPPAGGIRLMTPNTTEQGQVRGYIEAYKQCGIEDIIFYNYGMAPWPFLKQLEVI